MIRGEDIDQKPNATVGKGGRQSSAAHAGLECS